MVWKLKNLKHETRRKAKEIAPNSDVAAKSKTDTTAAPTREVKLPSDGTAYLRSLQNDEIVEYVYCTLKNVHAFKVAVKPSSGWMASELTEETWQGNLKIVDRGNITVVLLLDRTKNSIIAIYPVSENSIESCLDSSRYLILQVRDPDHPGAFQYTAIAFNERTSAFDFKVAIEESTQARTNLQVASSLSSELHRIGGLEKGRKLKVTFPKHEVEARQPEPGQQISIENMKMLLRRSFRGSKQSKRDGIIRPPINDTAKKHASCRPVEKPRGILKNGQNADSNVNFCLNDDDGLTESSECQP